MSRLCQLCLLILLFGESQVQAEPGWIYQTGPIAGLMAGLYDGFAVCPDVLKRGSSVGVGTFDHLDGEMIVLDDTVYAARQSGAVEAIKDCSTPFATVASFSDKATKKPWKNLDLSQLEAATNELIPSLNIPVMIKVQGTFEGVTLRVAPRQERPYKKLVDAIKQQPIFVRDRVSGTMVGFRMPAYLSGINVAGYHFHFISDDRKFAGHVFRLKVVNAEATIEPALGLSLGIPRDSAFSSSILAPASESEVGKVERAN